MSDHPTADLAGMARAGVLTPWQAKTLPAYVEAHGFEDLWANPYYRAVREHTRAYTERLFEQAHMA